MGVLKRLAEPVVAGMNLGASYNFEQVLHPISGHTQKWSYTILLKKWSSTILLQKWPIRNTATALGNLKPQAREQVLCEDEEDCRTKLLDELSISAMIIPHSDVIAFFKSTGTRTLTLTFYPYPYPYLYPILLPLPVPLPLSLPFTLTRTLTLTLTFYPYPYPYPYP